MRGTANLRTLEVAALFAVLAAFLTDTYQRRLDRPLGWDEAVYSLGGKALLDAATPTTYVQPHRPVGMRVLTIPGLLAGGEEIALRRGSAVWSLLVIVAFWILGRSTFGRWETLWALGLLLTLGELLERSGEVLNDLPSLTLLCLTLSVMLRELERTGGPSRRLLWVAPLAAATFYVRYGAIVPLGLAGVAALALWRREIAARWRIVLATVGLLALLLLPHLIAAVRATGLPVGIVTMSAAMAGHQYIGEGLVYYLRTWFLASGWAAGGVMACGVAYGALLLVRHLRARGVNPTSPVTERASGGSDRSALLLWIVATGHVLVTGLGVHGESRYLFPAFFLLMGLGTRGLARLVPRALFDRRWVAAVSCLALAALVVHQHWIRRAPTNRAAARPTSIVKLAAERIRADGDGPCWVATNGPPPQVGWYSRCVGSRLTGRATRDLMRLRGDRRYILVFRKTGRPLDDGARERLLALTRAVMVTRISDPSGGSEDDADLYRVGHRQRRSRSRRNATRSRSPGIPAGQPALDQTSK